MFCCHFECGVSHSRNGKSEFDSLRHHELPKSPDEDAKLQFAMTDKDHVHFGHDQFAYLGRFFTANELNMALD